eukprot:Sspe_Gene.95272::Locus_67572_Transcript_1_1_Confidence_1.000_Length_1084::g.95272::m.95272
MKGRGESNFLGKEEWLRAFARRHGIEFRTRRYVSRSLPELTTRVLSCWQHLRLLYVSGFQLSERGQFTHLINMDETPIYKARAATDKVTHPPHPPVTCNDRNYSMAVLLPLAWV